MKDLKDAFHLSIPVLWAYWFLGITYGMLASSLGFSIWIPISMAMLVYSGSVEFIALTLLCGVFHPLSAVIMALTVGARHLFYGISMLDRWRGAHHLKPFLIFMMSDETFAINYSAGGSFRRQAWVSALDYIYWTTGGIAGYLLGSSLPDSMMKHLEGLDFVVTAMFVSIFMDDFLRHKHSHGSAWLGLGATAACLALFGSQVFILPTMAVILIVLYISYRRKEVKK